MKKDTLLVDAQALEKRFQKGVLQELRRLQERGFSPIQLKDGYLVALQPDGAERRLYKVVTALRDVA